MSYIFSSVTSSGDLSLYDGDVEVLVRGKAGAELEFGNALYLAEQIDGLIVDWELMKNAKIDARLVKPSIKRISAHHGKPKSYCGDRGFDSPNVSETLDMENIINVICPRSVAKLKQKLHDPEFCADQQRRGATEARIGIFKNDYLGRPMRSKGFANRQTHVLWCVLAHNLWKLARMAAINRKQIEARKQKAA